MSQSIQKGGLAGYLPYPLGGEWNTQKGLDYAKHFNVMILGSYHFVQSFPVAAIQQLKDAGMTISLFEVTTFLFHGETKN